MRHCSSRAAAHIPANVACSKPHVGNAREARLVHSFIETKLHGPANDFEFVLCKNLLFVIVPPLPILFRVLGEPLVHCGLQRRRSWRGGSANVYFKRVAF